MGNMLTLYPIIARACWPLWIEICSI